MNKPAKHNTQTSPRWAFLKWFDIPDRENPDLVYLRRLRIVQTPLFAIYIHWIYLPDTDRDPHDHPWNFWSLILRGGYTERLHKKSGEQVLNAWYRGSFHKMSITHAHKITELIPGTVTMVVTGPRHRTWGFWTEEGFVKYMDYDKAEGYGPDPFMS